MAQADALKVAQARPFQDGLVIYFQPARHVMLGQQGARVGLESFRICGYSANLPTRAARFLSLDRAASGSWKLLHIPLLKMITFLSFGLILSGTHIPPAPGQGKTAGTREGPLPLMR